MEGVMRSLTIACAALGLASAWVLGDTFPVVGATYQLDRARYPDKVAICMTEQAMMKYWAAKVAKDTATANRMLVTVDVAEDYDKLKARQGCTLISSFSQATVVKAGKGFHRATFAAWGSEPMWAPALYFGRQVK
jgi:hypothetical protein